MARLAIANGLLGEHAKLGSGVLEVDSEAIQDPSPDADPVALVSGAEELQDILAHPFVAWRTFLHPAGQRDLPARPAR